MDTLEEPPPGEHFLAGSFAMCQTDEVGELKLRRAEDWRRSGHNATVRVCDVPTHHDFIGSFVDLARRMAADSTDLVVFGNDLLNAYRHSGRNFGATASVWNFITEGGPSPGDGALRGRLQRASTTPTSASRP